MILASHLGRPKGTVVEELRLTPVAKLYLNNLVKKLRRLMKPMEILLKQLISEMNAGDVLLLENVRFYPGEEKNDPELAKAFADLSRYLCK